MSTVGSDTLDLKFEPEKMMSTMREETISEVNREIEENFTVKIEPIDGVEIKMETEETFDSGIPFVSVGVLKEAKKEECTEEDVGCPNTSKGATADTPAATAAPPAVAATAPEEEELPTLELAPSPVPSLLQEEEEQPTLELAPSPVPSLLQEEEEEPQPKGKSTKKSGAASTKSGAKHGWSLPDQTENDLVEWLRHNSYLWLRSTKDFHKKRAAWEMKAAELGVTLEHLQKWWKNVKDWFVKLTKKTSGQATRQLTDRDKWVLKNIAFYKSSLPTDVPDTLVDLPRDQPSTTCSSSQDDEEATLLEDLEVAAAAEQSSTVPPSYRKRKRRTAAESQEEAWMGDIRSTLRANQVLLEKLLEENTKQQPTSIREAFITYVSDVLRSASEADYRTLQGQMNEVCQRYHAVAAAPFPSAPRPSTSIATTQYQLIPPAHPTLPPHSMDTHQHTQRRHHRLGTCRR